METQGITKTYEDWLSQFKIINGSDSNSTDYIDLNDLNLAIAIYDG